MAHAQNAEIALEDERYFERLDEWGRVSGDIVMGVMMGPAPAEDEEGKRQEVALADDVPRSTADVAVLRLPPIEEPQEDAGRYCVRINSTNGRFEAVNTYSVGAAVPATGGIFPYFGSYKPDLDEMRAVTLVKVGHCGDRTDLVVPSVWQDAEEKADRDALHVFVNSAGNPTIAVPGSDPDFVECSDVSDDTTLKYTSACILPRDVLAPHLEDGRVRLTFYVTRSLGEESFEIDIVLPDGRD
ncbi:hypothetical protein OCH239_20100 [Roseivivax halodurans JCM 10272]|uniref:Uncharacterized protein n=1 Tax=Roseivivax halodurans JCM 10272 TaxID=1449350 RepID=X7E674_9RHOB|nr:hypothetical protein OCH239_20100 [Roseivivax halodurans JCM 10272]